MERGHKGSSDTGDENSVNTYKRITQDDTICDGGNNSGTHALDSREQKILQTNASSAKAWGRAKLLSVAFLYGTDTVACRLIYTTEGPSVASVMSFVRNLIAIVAYIPLYIGSTLVHKGELRKKEEVGQQWGKGEETRPLVDIENGEKEDKLVPEKIHSLWMTAFGLALWSAGSTVSTVVCEYTLPKIVSESCYGVPSLKQGFLNAGLQYIPAARLAFLLQMSVVVTPLLTVLMGERPGALVWGGCGMSLFGIFLISTSPTATVQATSAADTIGLTFNKGDAMALLPALMYSLYIIRLSKIAKSYSKLNLEFAKTCFAALVYAVWVLAMVALALTSTGTPFSAHGSVEALPPLWMGWKSSPSAWLLISYNAIAIGVVASMLLQQGQKVTSASEANIILTMDPVFATVCAYAFLGEMMSP